LKRIEVVPDNEHEIGEAVNRLSAQHDFVFTSGGIGMDGSTKITYLECWTDSDTLFYTGP
jgi:molybdopterin biosynthesis enzyme MoaB